MHVIAAPTALEAALQQEMGELQADNRKLQSEVADLQNSLTQVLPPPPPPSPGTKSRAEPSWGHASSRQRIKCALAPCPTPAPNSSHRAFPQEQSPR